MEIARKVNVSLGTAYKYAMDVSFFNEAKSRLNRRIGENQARFAEKFVFKKSVIVRRKK